MKHTLSPKQLARAIGASESSLKRWVDEGRIHAGRTAGGHRRISISDAVQFVRETNATVIRPEIFGLAEMTEVQSDLPAREDEAERLLSYLLDGRAAEARGLVMSMYLDGRSVAEIVDGPVTHAMMRIGELWEHSEEGILIEHRATDICVQAISQLRLTFPSTNGGPIAVGGAPAGDPYILPSMVAATVLASAGFSTVNLGPDTPVDSLLLAAEHHDARLVWLSVSSNEAPSRLRRGIATLVEGLGAAGLSLVIGGRVIGDIRLPRAANLHVGRSMTELAAFARGVALASHKDE